MKKRDLEIYVSITFRLAEKLSETILEMKKKMVNTTGVMEDIQALLERLQDLQTYSNQSQKQSDEVFTLINGINVMQNTTTVRIHSADLPVNVCISSSIPRCVFVVVSWWVIRVTVVRYGALLNRAF